MSFTTGIKTTVINSVFWKEHQDTRASLVAQMVKNLSLMQETWVQSLGWEDPLEEGMTTHSSIPALRIPWTEEPGRFQPTGLERVGYTHYTIFFFLISKVNKLCIHMCSVIANSFMIPWTVACQASLSMGFSRREYQNGLPVPYLWDLCDPGIEASTLAPAVL